MSASIPTQLAKHLYFYGEALKSSAQGNPTFYRQEASKAMLEDLCEILIECGETTLADQLSLKGGTK